MNEGESETGSVARELPVGSPGRGRPLPSFEQARAALEEGRRAYRVAEFVQARRTAGGVDSAVTAHRALTLALRLLVEVHGEEPPDKFADLARRASDIAVTENLLAGDHREDLELIDRMRTRLFDGSPVSPAEDRQYDRAFLRASEWFVAVDAYLAQKLRASSRPSASLKVAGLAALVFAVGVVAGRETKNRPAPVAGRGRAAPGPSAGAEGPAFTATFFRDTVFSEPTLTRRDGSIAFDWGPRAPVESLPADNFAVRWEGNLFISSPAKYAFYLTSDDGSRLTIDGALVIDNWGSHAEHTEEASVELSEGSHRLRVEFFDKVGPAIVRFEWSSEKFNRRLVTSADLI